MTRSHPRRSRRGTAPPATPRPAYDERLGAHRDGEPYGLRAPRLGIDDLADRLLAPDVLTSVRVAQQIVGLGLLAAVDEATLLARAHPDGADGISGRPTTSGTAAAAGRSSAASAGFRTMPAADRAALVRFLESL